MKAGEIRPLNSTHVNLAPDSGGIYCIYDETAGDMPAYLGCSSNIRRRLNEHLSRRGSKSIAMLIEHRHDLWFSFGYSNNPYGSEAAELARLSPTGKLPGNRKREIKNLESF